jgi:DnaJ-class molecular chaperone
MKTLYEVLEISHKASAEEVKKAFRRKSLKYHPDINPAEDAAETFRLVYYAYLVLSEPELRRRYDEKLLTIGRKMMTLYDILNVPLNTPLPDIKRSFRSLAFQYHPDFNPAQDAADRFRLIYYANMVLSNDQKRDRYDQKIAQFGYE